jgi:hypothetical protein
LIVSTGGIYKKGPDGDSSSAYQNQVITYYLCSLRQGLILSQKKGVLLIFLLFLKITDDGQVNEANNLQCDIPFKNVI